MKNSVFALDLGTTKFCLANIGNKINESLHIDIVSSESNGIHRGMLCDLPKATSALNKLIETAEKQFNRDIDRVVVGVSGCHLSSYSINKTASLGGSTIEQKTIESLEKLVKSEHESTTSEIIHVEPITFSLDDRIAIENPCGLSGRDLTANFFVIEANKSYLMDLVRLCNSCGLRVERFAAEPYASALVTAEETLKNLGVIIADIGGGTTDCILFTKGQPAKVFTINVGGEIMTNDLAVGLGLCRTDAEKLKMIWGLSTHQHQNDNSDIEIINAVGRTVKINSSQVYNILAPRIRELGELIISGSQSEYRQTSAGIVLTGGGSEVIGISSFLGHELKIPVQRNLPSSIEISNKNLNSRFATIVGLIKIIMSSQNKNDNTPIFIARYISPIISWFREF